jgi:hypothetical protein
MSERTAVRLHSLPDGEFREAVETCWSGSLLELDLLGQGPEWPRGVLLEIECGSMLYLGELQRQSGSQAAILVEHVLDRAKLAPLQESWG